MKAEEIIIFDNKQKIPLQGQEIFTIEGVLDSNGRLTKFFGNPPEKYNHKVHKRV